MFAHAAALLIQFNPRDEGQTLTLLLKPSPFHIELVVHGIHACGGPGHALRFFLFRVIAHLASERDFIAGSLHGDLACIQQRAAFKGRFDVGINCIRAQLSSTLLNKKVAHAAVSIQ